MTLLTLFSAPKPFTDPHIATIQRNAIKSWTLFPEVDVILLGNESGLGQFARELGLKHLPNVVCNENGTPLISSMLQLARENSSGDLLGIVNADMIILPDFVESARQVLKLKEKFVLLSRRWDYDIVSPLEFTNGWESRLRESVRKQNQLHRPAGSDFFLFPRSCYPDIPSFAIGRAGWDNWMIYKARAEKYPVVDCTPSMMIVHQNHDYGHLPGARPHYDHPESETNTKLAGGHAAIRYTILDSTHQLINGKLTRPKMSSSRFMRGVELSLRRLFFFLPEDQIENIVRPKRWKKRLMRIFR